MSELIEEQRIRYPPFEPSRWESMHLPIAVEKHVIGTYPSKEQAIAALKDCPPSFKLGDEHSWLIERRYLYANEVLSVQDIRTWSESNSFPIVVKKQRTGWYLTPSPIHHQIRKFINTVVILLLLSLFYLAISPFLILLNLPVYGIETVRWGLLDYPLLAMIIVPLIFLPLGIKVVANLFEIKRQNLFLKRQLKPPIIEFLSESVADQPLNIQITFPDKDENWLGIEVSWRVGILAPSRESVFQSLKKSLDGQPPPGLSTELPHHWEAGLDDGTAGGEDAPMQRQEVKGGLFLRPMRIMEMGESKPLIEGQPIQLSPPHPTWPGSVCTELLRVHWECIFKIERKNGGSLLWVQPLKVASPSVRVEFVDLPVYDGRSESDIT